MSIDELIQYLIHIKNLNGNIQVLDSDGQPIGYDSFHVAKHDAEEIAISINA